MAGKAVVRKIVNTTLAPKPVGPYSQAVVVDRTVYISGQIGLNPATGKLVEGGVEAQTEQVLNNLKCVVEGAGSRLENVVKTTILLQNIADYGKVNGVYAKFFSSTPPSRAAFAVSALPAGALVEIEAVAVVGEVQDVAP